MASYPGLPWTTCTALGWYSSAASEDFLGYVAPGLRCRRDRIATALIEAAVTGNALSMESDERFAALEMV